MRNVTNLQLRYAIFWISIVGFSISSQSQNCFDADFESGTVGGYQTYQGIVESDGSLSFFNNNVDPEQHGIMAIEDGYDPIAEMWCIENKYLPVAGQGAGRYSLRLGDSEGGRKTSKVVLSFEVTPNVSFFLLKYAVVLEDPMHEEHEQPKFELFIKDQLGTVLDCGEYSVTAAGDIPGFEVCGNWRVRPWTTAGFELQSYIGQTINIEIVSQDCALGAHGGYAYIDATCKPLELILDSYCPDSTFARYFVTEGFDTYQWNTGDVTNIIEIEDASPGEEYSVTVTSSTGCTLVLRDTLPELPDIDDLDFSFFDGPDTLYVCEGDEVAYTPSGTNIDVVESIELGYSAQSFNFFATESKDIHFVTRDNFGCLYDTMQLSIIVRTIEVEAMTQKTCQGESNGSIVINNLSTDQITTSIANGAFTSNLVYENLFSGDYVLKVRNEYGCEEESIVTVDVDFLPILSQIDVTPATCDLNNGIIKVSTSSSDVKYSLDGSSFSTINSWYNMSGGTYILEYTNLTGCMDTESITVPKHDPPVIATTSTDTVFCGYNDGFINCTTTGGLAPLKYSIGGGFDWPSNYQNLGPGNYIVIVQDDAQCRDTAELTIAEDPYVWIENVDITPANCAKDNGAMEISLQHEDITYDLYLDNESIEDLSLDQLPQGSYTLSVIDINGCTNDYQVTIPQVLPPKFESISFVPQDCGDNSVTAMVQGKSYTDKVFYAVNDNALQQGEEIALAIGTNTIKIVDEVGCEIDTTIVVPDTQQYQLANIFSPNGDGVNDLLCFQHKERIELFEHVYIFDRWGNQVYGIENEFNTDYNTCWDGTTKDEPVDLGVYVYHLKARLADGRLLCRSGDVTVIR